MKKYELLIFDFDGTLVDTVGDIAFYANQILSAQGIPEKSIDQVKRAVGRGVHELLRDLGFKGSDQELDEAVLTFKAKYRENPIRYSQPFPWVRDVLEGPLKKIKKAIITNKPQDITLQILMELKLSAYFDKLIGMHAGFPAKPDPTSTDSVIGAFGVQKQNVIFIGDSSVDAQTAANAGIDFAFVNYGYDALNGHPAVRTFSSPAEWAGLVK